MSTAATQHTSDGRRREYPAPSGFTDEAAWVVTLTSPDGGVTLLAKGAGYSIRPGGKMVDLAIPAPRGAVVTVRRADRLGSSRWDDLPAPIIIAHRGSGEIVAPGNTMAAFRWAAGLGYIVEADLQYTADKALICNHDSTLNAPTGRTDNLTAAMLPLDTVRRLDFAQGYLPQIFSPQRPVTFEEYAELARAGVLLAPEVRGTTGEMGADVARRIVNAGLQHAFLVQSLNAAELIAAREVDPTIRTMRVASVTTEEAVANGYWAVCPEQSALLGALGGKTYVDAMHAAGVKVFAFTVNYLEQAEALNAIGVDGYFSDDAPHIAKAGTRIPAGQTTTLKVPPFYSLSGWRWASAKTGVYPAVDAGFATFAGYEGFTASQNFKLTVDGRRTADAPAVQSISTTVKVIEGAPNADATRYLAVYFCWKTEFDGAAFAGGAGYNSNGYYFAHRLNGTVEIVRVIDAGYSVLATATWTAIAKGQTVPIRINLTASGITVTRTDTSQTITATDATHSRGGFVRLLGSGIIPGIGDVAITY